MTYYIIKSCVNKDNYNISHEVLNITDDYDESETFLKSLIKDIKGKKKINDNVVTYNDGDNIITIQLHQHNIDENNVDDAFMDDDNDDNDDINNDDNDGNITEEFLNFHSNMSNEELQLYLNRVTSVVNESVKQTGIITEKYKKIISKKKLQQINLF